MSQALLQRQHELMDFLLEGDEDINKHIVVHGNISTETRLHIYRNAYQTRLHQTIDTDHPVTGIYLGDELFDIMVSRYTEQHSSRHRSLRHFADDLPVFLATQEPFCSSPQIGELARFERLLLTAFDSADGPRAASEELCHLPAEAWPTMTLGFHPSVRLFQSDWNVVALWQAIKTGSEPPASEQGTETWLLWRNDDLLTEFRHVDESELCMLKQFLAGRDFAASCESLLAIIPENEVSSFAAGTLLRWLELGLIGRITDEKAHRIFNHSQDPEPLRSTVGE